MSRKVKPEFTAPQASVVRYALSETLNFWESQGDREFGTGCRALAELDRAMQEANPVPEPVAPAPRQLESGETWHRDCHRQGCIRALHGGGHCGAGACAVLTTRL